MPFYRCTIDSPYSVQEVVQRLSKEVAPPHHWRDYLQVGGPSREKEHLPFTGHCNEQGFQMRRARKKRNKTALLPNISGKLSPTATGTRVAITMTPSLWEVLFLLVSLAIGWTAEWFAFGGFGVSPILIVIALAILLAICWPVLSFYSEARDSHWLLKQLLGVPVRKAGRK